MSDCLIIGSPGAGKSSLVAELRNRQRLAYDADLVPGLLGWYDENGKGVTGYDSSQAWRDSHLCRWDIARMARFLDHEQPETLYVAGIAPNWPDAVPLFRRLIYLDVSVETACERIAHPDRSTPFPFDCTDQYRMQLRENLPGFREKAVQLGAVAINAELGISQIADDLITLVEDTACTQA